MASWVEQGCRQGPGALLVYLAGSSSPGGGCIAPERPRLGVPGLDARRRRTGVTPLANFRVDRSLPVPGGARPEGRERPGQARPHLRRCVLRGPNFVDCPSPSRRAARSPRP